LLIRRSIEAQRFGWTTSRCITIFAGLKTTRAKKTTRRTKAISLKHRIHSKAGRGEAEQNERRALGLPAERPAPAGLLKHRSGGRGSLTKTAICAPQVLNEAPEYGSAFSRGLRLEQPSGVTQLLLSGTASVGKQGETLYADDFRAQLWRTYYNLTKLLESEGATWEDVVRTTCYLKNIERDYEAFNEIRSEFFRALGLDPFPASTAVQAGLCRKELLVEIEAVAMF
jgi:2-iminobutanoate/2-iminopropanoate deaminase